MTRRDRIMIKLMFSLVMRTLFCLVNINRSRFWAESSEETEFKELETKLDYWTDSEGDD